MNKLLTNVVDRERRDEDLFCRNFYIITLVAVVILVLFLAFIYGCPGLIPGDLKSPAEMTPKELSTWANGIYNAQYDNYEILAARTDLTEDYKVMLRKKKEILTELWPYLKLYTGYVDSGAVPTAELEAKIIGLVDRLILSALE